MVYQMMSKFKSYLQLSLCFSVVACQTASPKDPQPIPTPDSHRSADAAPHDSGPPQQEPTTPSSDFQSQACAGTYDPPESYFSLPGTILLEISGLSPSLRQENLYWAHNDSGDAAQLYAIDTDGNHRASLQISNTDARDFEDMASGPCPNSTEPCLYIADVGDNRHERPHLLIHILEEPDLGANLATQTITTNAVKTITLTFTGLKPNIEGFVIDNTRDFGFLFEKTEDDSARLFRLNLNGETTQSLTALGLFSNPSHDNLSGQNKLVTAAAYHSSAKRLLLKTYGGMYEYRFVGGKNIEDIDSITPIVLSERPSWELQGEAITYNHHGDVVVSASEDPLEQGGQQVSQLKCSASP